MVFWQLTIDANDPAVLARFWAQALGYQPAPPADRANVACYGTSNRTTATAEAPWPSLGRHRPAP